MTFRFALQYAANHDFGKIDAACAKAAFSDWWDTSGMVDAFAELQEPDHAG